MNRYTRITLGVSSANQGPSLPIEVASQIGDQIQVDVTTARDQILGPIRPGENLEQYRLRGYQAWITAEELAVADHLTSRSESDDENEAPILESYHQTLAMINETIHTQA